jgi:hypothetical protein
MGAFQPLIDGFNRLAEIRRGIAVLGGDSLGGEYATIDERVQVETADLIDMVARVVLEGVRNADFDQLVAAGCAMIVAHEVPPDPVALGGFFRRVAGTAVGRAREMLCAAWQVQEKGHLDG